MENLAIYNKVRAVPKEATKPFNNGNFSGTDINPMWRLKTLTDVFGPCGIGWYYEVLSERSECIDATHTIAIVDINLYVKVDGEWSKPIFGTGGNMLLTEVKDKATNTMRQKVSDDGYKMALTDAISVACKALGVGADIYWQNDRTKYTAATQEASAQAPAPQQAPQAGLRDRLRQVAPAPVQQAAPQQAPKDLIQAAQAQNVVQMPAHTDNAKPAQRMAAPGQIRFICENCSKTELRLTQDKYGPDLSAMPYATAAKIITKLQERMTIGG